MGAGRKTETIICNENPPGSNAAGTNIITYRKLSKNKLKGVIFGCSRSTIAECLSKKLFGLPTGHFCYVENISPGLPLFLFNYNDRKLHGIYEAASDGQLYINSNAWTEDGKGNKTPFPAQVSIRIRTQCQPLSEKQYKNIIEKNYYTHIHFWFELDDAQTNGLIAAFKRSVATADKRTLPQGLSNFRALPPPTSIMTKGKVPVVPGTKLKEIAEHEQLNADGTRRSEDLEACTKLVDVLGNEEEFPALPWSKRKEVVQCGLSDGPCKRSEDLEASTKLVDMLSNEEEFPALPSSKRKEVVQCGLSNGPCKRSEDPKPSTVSVNENSFACLPCDGEVSHHSSPSHSSSCVLSDWEDLSDPTPSLYGVNQTGQKQQSGSEELENEEERVLHKLEKLFADRECFVSSSKCCTDDSDVPSTRRNMHEHLLDEPTVSVEKQKGSSAFDLHNVHAEDREKSSASYVNLGNVESMELLQVISKLEERTEQLEKRQVESDREVLQLKSFVRDTQRENQLLKNRVTELELRFDPSTLLVDGSLGKFVEQYLLPEDVIYLIGGFDGSSWLSSLDCFTPSLDILTPLKQMRSTRPFASAVALDDALYVFGGGSDNLWFDSVERYDRRYDEWTPCPFMLRKKGSLAGTTLNGKIYAIGGSDGVECLSEVETFDPASGRWIYNQSMIDRRFSSAAAELEGVIYAVGGFDGKKHLRSAEKFDPREGHWSALPNMNTRRCSHSIAAFNGKLYCVGGYDGQKMISSVEVYDPRLNKWVMGEPMKFVRGYPAAVVLGNLLFAIGGIKDEKNIVNVVECYQEGTGWTDCGWKAIGRRSFCSAIAPKG